MNITLLDPFHTGSHAAWATEYRRCSRHQIDLLSLSGRHWKWRMHGGALTLARHFLARDHKPDLLLATDMLDLTTFLALTRPATATLPTALYFHENQLTYPWSPDDLDPGQKRDAHYGFINFASALAADLVLFNSAYHLETFFAALPPFLRAFPDHPETAAIDSLRRKSQVLPLGLDLQRLDAFRPADPHPAARPLILWNHRWEYDKNPDEFFQVLFRLQDEGLEFDLALLGESFARQPAIFAAARQRLGKRIVHFGYADDFADYARWLWRSDLLPVTSRHDFFGASVVQAMYCNVHPLLPPRLAYPEHVPAAQRGDFFYADGDDLLVRLRRALQSFPSRRRRDDLRTLVSRYDWSAMAPRYDTLLENLAGKLGHAIGREG